MKRILVFCVTCIVAMSAFAAELNIYASGLKAGVMNSNKTVELQYLLNAPATALEINILNAENGSVVSTVNLTDTYLTKGTHTYLLDVSQLPVASYKWEIKATAEARTQVEEVDTKLSFYGGQDVAVDNNFDSDYFGRVYVANGLTGNSNGVDQVQGVFIYNSDLTNIREDNNGFTGGITWGTDGTVTYNRLAVSQLQIDEEGNVFVANRTNAASKGVYMINPAAPEINFTPLVTNVTKVSAFTIVGTGENRVVYIIDDLDGVRKYTSDDNTTWNNEEYMYNTWNKKWTQKRDMKMVNDGKDGFWIFQSNADNALKGFHLNAAKVGANPSAISDDTKDYDFTTATGITVPSTTTRGAGDINYDYTQLAVAGDNKIYLYDITWDESTNTPVLTDATIEMPATSTTDWDGVSFDRAGNLFAITGYDEILYAFALPKADNSFTTPAPASQLITVVSQVVSVTGVSTDQTLAMFVGDTYQLTATVQPEDATDKSVVWSLKADDAETEVLTIASDGTVNALKAGQAVVVVTTVDGNFTAECTITVNAVPVESVELNKSSITLYVGDSETLSANVLPINATNKEIGWDADDESIVSVNNGIVKAKTVGSTMVYAYSIENQRIEDQCEVIVKENPYPSIFAYGLQVIEQPNTTSEITIGFNLNAPAKEVKVIAYDAESVPTTVATLTNLAEGNHEEKISVVALAIGSYTWAIEASADVISENNVVKARTYAIEDKFLGDAARGIAIDNNTESPFFSNVYLTKATASAANSGFYIYDPMLQTDGVLHGGPFAGTISSPNRIIIGEDGLLYMSDASDLTPNIYIVDPAKLEDASIVFDTVSSVVTNTGGTYTTLTNDFIHGSMSSCYVKGSGADRVLYTVDEDGGDGVHLFRYDIGEMNSLWNTAPTADVMKLGAGAIWNSNIVADKNGGWWVARSLNPTTAAEPAVVHYNAAGEIDCRAPEATTARAYGAMMFNEDQTLGASTVGSHLYVWDITWTDNVPAMTLKYDIITAYNSAYSLAFDYADNIFISSDLASYEIFALPKAENKMLTPAPSVQKIIVTNTGTSTAIDNLNVNDNTMHGVYSVTGQWLGENTDMLPQGVYIVNGKKVVK